MTTTVCIAPINNLHYPQGGGHLWVTLNWALALRSLGFEVIWLEGVEESATESDVRFCLDALERSLQPFGFAERVALYPLGDGSGDYSSYKEAAAEADLLVNFSYKAPRSVVKRFARSALIDIDPGLLQRWMYSQQIDVAEHDIYFTIGETVGRPGALFPDCGIEWLYTPPAVFLAEWPEVTAPEGAPYTTVSIWWGEWALLDDEVFSNEKRTSFLEYVDVAARAGSPLELALTLSDWDGAERENLERHGWRVRHAWEVSATPQGYRSYIQQSRGEFSCAKPSCMRLQNAWISDRTLCYLASGKPAIVQHTGPSGFLPDDEGMFRFRNPDEAVKAFNQIESDYERHARLARKLAEEHFDARRVVASVIERALP